MYPTLNIFLAYFDIGDCLFFKETIEDLKLPEQLTTVNNGEQLVHYLSSSINIPHTIFLERNSPRKSGFKCLTEIKNKPCIKNLPVVVFSTSYDMEKANFFNNKRRHYHICKPSYFANLKSMIYRARTALEQNNLLATKNNFYINKLETAF